MKDGSDFDGVLNRRWRDPTQPEIKPEGLLLWSARGLAELFKDRRRIKFDPLPKGRQTASPNPDTPAWTIAEVVGRAVSVLGIESYPPLTPQLHNRRSQRRAHLPYCRLPPPVLQRAIFRKRFVRLPHRYLIWQYDHSQVPQHRAHMHQSA